MGSLGQKQTVLERIKELQPIVLNPWHEIHKLISDLDGCHNRIYGLGIKDYSYKAWEAIGELIQDLEADIAKDEGNQKIYVTDLK